MIPLSSFFLVLLGYGARGRENQRQIEVRKISGRRRSVWEGTEGTF